MKEFKLSEKKSYETYEFDRTNHLNKVIWRKEKDVKEFIKDILSYIKERDNLLINKIKERAGGKLI